MHGGKRPLVDENGESLGWRNHLSNQQCKNKKGEDCNECLPEGTYEYRVKVRDSNNNDLTGWSDIVTKTLDYELFCEDDSYYGGCPPENCRDGTPVGVCNDERKYCSSNDLLTDGGFEKSGFREANKYAAFVYSGVEGNVYVSSNYRVMVNIDGHVRSFKKAIKEGKLEGVVWQNLHSECYIVPRLHKEGGHVDVVGLVECTTTDCYHRLNKRHDINYELKEV